MSTKVSTTSPAVNPPVEPTAEPPIDPLKDPALRRSIAAIMVGAMAVVFDTTILSIAIPTLSTDFDVPLNTIQWVVTAYLLAMFAVIPLTGWAQRRLGGKRLWIASVGLFTLGSLLCGFAWDATSLIAFRALQGLGGGVIVPLMATILMQAAGGRAPGRLMAVVGLPMALGPIMGPVLGGIILHYVHWSWLFWINIPLGLLGIAMAVRMLPADPRTERPRLDILGVILSTVGVVALIYGLSNVAGDGGFGHADVLIPGIGGIALVVGDVFYALRKGEDALIDLALLKHRPLAMSTLLMFLAGIAMYAAMFMLPLFYQQLRGSDVLATGLLLIPQGVGALASRSIAGRLTDQIGPRWVVVAGFAIMTAATVPFALADQTTNGFVLGIILFVRGLGVGGVFMPLMATAYVGLAHDEIPHASIVTRVAQQIGGSFSIAVVAVVLQSQVAGVTSAAGAATAFNHTFWWVVAFMVVGLLAAPFLPGKAEMNAVPDDDLVAAAEV